MYGLRIWGEFTNVLLSSEFLNEETYLSPQIFNFIAFYVLSVR